MAREHPVSILILTKDEERNLPGCLESVSFSDDIVVFDSFSTDRTVEIARSHPGVRVIQRRFDDWSSHQNYAMRRIDYAHPWVFYIDADERLTPDLVQELRTAAAPDSPFSAFRLRRKDHFLGRWLRHATIYPTWLVRLFRPERMRFERTVHVVPVVDGPVGDLEGHLMHYPFSKGVAQWFERHNAYSELEAHELLGVSRRPLRARDLARVASRDPNLRRAALKDLFYRLPARPKLKWLYFMLVRRAWRDGRPGRLYARMTSVYEEMIAIKHEALALGIDAESERDPAEVSTARSRAPGHS